MPCYPSESWRNRPTAAGSTAQGLAWDWQQQVLASSATLPVSAFESTQNHINYFFPPRYFIEGISHTVLFWNNILTHYHVNQSWNESLKEYCRIPVLNQQVSHELCARDINNPMQDSQREGEQGREGEVVKVWSLCRLLDFWIDTVNTWVDTWMLLACTRRPTHLTRFESPQQ